MKWYIEYLNGIIISENNSIFKADISKLKKVYFSNGKHRYGFYRNGIFFIDRYNYDFKINIDNFDMELFQYKTNKVIIGNDISIDSWNIGYYLINNEEKYKYNLSIKENKSIYIEAYHYKNNKTTDKYIRLR